MLLSKGELLLPHHHMEAGLCPACFNGPHVQAPEQHPPSSRTTAACAGEQVSEIKLRSLPFLRADTPVYDMLRLFETGRCHMALLTEPPDSRTGGSSAPDASIARAGQMADLLQIRADPPGHPCRAVVHV